MDKIVAIATLCFAFAAPAAVVAEGLEPVPQVQIVTPALTDVQSAALDCEADCMAVGQSPTWCEADCTSDDAD